MQILLLQVSAPIFVFTIKNDGNPHAHVLFIMSPFEIDGSWDAKSRKEYILDDSGERIKLKRGEFKTYKTNAVDWNEQTKAEEWRAAWAQSVNSVLEQRGIITESGNQNREMAVRNGLLSSILEKLKQLKAWLKEAVSTAAHNTREEKPSIVAQLEMHKKEIKGMKNSEPSPLTELYVSFDAALKKLSKLMRV